MNNTATTTTYNSTYHVARPVYGAKAHSGYVQTVVYADGRIEQNIGTFCAVTVQYNPNKSPSMPLAEVATIITCPKCIRRTAAELTDATA